MGEVLFHEGEDEGLLVEFHELQFHFLGRVTFLFVALHLLEDLLLLLGNGLLAELLHDGNLLLPHLVVGLAEQEIEPAQFQFVFGSLVDFQHF